MSVPSLNSFQIVSVESLNCRASSPRNINRWCKCNVRCNFVQKKKRKRKEEKRREKYQLSRWKSACSSRAGEVGNLRRYWPRWHRRRKARRQRRKEGEPRTHREWGCPRQELPRYATRARDVTRPVTRAPCALGHVSRHALAAAASPLHRPPPHDFIAGRWFSFLVAAMLLLWNAVYIVCVYVLAVRFIAWVDWLCPEFTSLSFPSLPFHFLRCKSFKISSRFPIEFRDSIFFRLSMSRPYFVTICQSLIIKSLNRVFLIFQHINEFKIFNIKINNLYISLIYTTI